MMELDSDRPDLECIKHHFSSNCLVGIKCSWKCKGLDCVNLLGQKIY